MNIYDISNLRLTRLILILCMLSLSIRTMANPPQIEAIIKQMKDPNPETQKQGLAAAFEIKDWSKYPRLKDSLIDILKRSHLSDKNLAFIIQHMDSHFLSDTHYTLTLGHLMATKVDSIVKNLSHDKLSKQFYLKFAKSGLSHLSNVYLEAIDNYPQLLQDPQIKQVFIEHLKNPNSETFQTALKVVGKTPWFSDPKLAPVVGEYFGRREKVKKKLSDNREIIVEQFKSENIELLKGLKGTDWAKKPAYKHRVIAMMSDEKLSEYTYELLKDSAWYDDHDINSKVVDLFYKESPGTKHALSLMLNPKALANPELMVEFGDAYLKLPDNRKIQLLVNYPDLFAKIYHPHTEFVIIQDLGQLLRQTEKRESRDAGKFAILALASSDPGALLKEHRKNKMDIKKTFALLESKIEHPEAQNVLFEYMKQAPFSSFHDGHREAFAAAEILMKSPASAKLVAPYWLSLLQSGDVNHPLFFYARSNSVITHPTMQALLPEAEYLALIERLSVDPKLDWEAQKVVKKAHDQLKRQNFILHDEQFLDFYKKLEQAIVKKDHKAVQALTQQTEYMPIFQDKDYTNNQEVLNQLYEVYKDQPLVTKKIAKLDALDLTQQIPFNESEMRFVDFIEGLDTPREYLNEMRTRHSQKNNMPELDQLLNRFASEGKLSANDPLGKITRALMTRTYTPTTGIIGCIMRNMPGKNP